jgi:C-terminal processing protease CtpA/Prc
LARGASYHLAMAQLLLALICATLTPLGQAQGADSGRSTDRSGLAEILSFETEHPGGSPGGWGGSPAGTIFVDGKVVHGGRWSARIERQADSPGAFSSMTKSIPMDFAGTKIELRGFLRTEGVSDFVMLWLREDSESGTAAFDNMRRRQLKGTTDWAEYSITLPVAPEARQLFFGVLLVGTGKAWADDLRLLVDGKPVWEAPRFERPKTAIDLDHEFDGGSGTVLKELTKVQIENLATLGKVWGFLKYHHSQVTSGQRHWDYDLFRVLPAILAARDRTAVNGALLHWIIGLGPVGKCEPCAKLDESRLHFRPEVDWIADEALLGADLSQSLRSIHRNRPAAGRQFYVSLAGGVGNPPFDHEPNYKDVKLPDAGFQLLGLYRFWNIIAYWFPYRDVLGEDWDKVLAQFIPRIALAKDADTYQRELMALIAKAHDTHANLWSSLRVRPPVGDCELPVQVRFIENQAVVTGYGATEAGRATGLKIGDVITELDGIPVPKLVETWAPYYAASNDPTRLRDIARSMTRGDCGESRIRVRRESETIELTAKRLRSASQELRRTHDLPGETFRLLSEKVAYLKLSSVKAAEAARYIEAAAGTKGLIIDIRNYPSEFVVFALGSLLVEKQTEFARFTTGDLSNPGAFHWMKPLSLSPKNPHYSGKVVILVDESTQSSAEYTSMAFRAAPQAMVVGSTTAGADGDVSRFGLPGGLRAMISGFGVFYPDKRPTQRIGIVPDVEVRPTIAGIRAGRDEVLEEALRRILGPETSAAEIEKMAKP